MVSGANEREIVEHIGVISESAKGWTKGVTLTEEEASKLKALL